MKVPKRTSAPGVQVRFENNALHRSVVNRASVLQDEGTVYLIFDYALSNSDRADYSVGIAVLRTLDLSNKAHFHILDGIYGKWDAAELVSQIVSFAAKHQPRQVIIEKLAMFQLLDLCVRKEAIARKVALTIRGIKPSKRPDAKRDRVKLFQDVFDTGRVNFVLGGDWLEVAFDQLLKFNSKRGNSSRRDDFCDVLGYAAQFLK